MDPLMLLFLLIAGLTGADSVSTVNWVSAWRGGSVTIPCFYGDRYKTNVKYWCRGREWRSCTPIVRSDSPQEGKVSIRDDPDQRVFTVTINNLTAGDSGYYSCGVKVNGLSESGTWVELSVTDGVSTVKTVSVQGGGSVTIPCFYEDRYETDEKYWCRGYNVRSCTPVVHSDSPQEGNVSIRDDPDQRVFTVTINNLTVQDSNGYSCGVKISGRSDAEASLYLSVTDDSTWLSVDKQEVTGVEGDSVSVQCHYGNSGSLKLWCKIGGSCASERSGSLDGRPVLIRDDRVNKVFSVTMGGLERKDTGWYWCADRDHQIPVHITVNQATTTTTSTEETTVLTPGSASVSVTIKPSAPGSTPTGANDKEQSSLVQLALYVGLGLLVLLLIIIIITWKVRDKHKKQMVRNQHPGSTELTLNPDYEYAAVDRTGIIRRAPTDQLNPDYEYAAVDRTGIIRRAPTDQASEEPGADVTYSSIVLSDPEQVSSRCSSHRPAVTPASDVVYSSVALKHREGAATQRGSSTCGELLLRMRAVRDTQILQ
ncbi:polymeric immunoglobulin receptor-like isoform X3 [Paramormyrops kingsleyae]|uniref:polymeric immunoglobulin receptor-like isoform X3 n=1 Tax=Paramormyrops kingsleyae TaxID=1676925 RepID=UPI003B97CAB4